MFTLIKEKADIHTFDDRTYYVFPAPATHENQINRPHKYAAEKDTEVYKGPGSNGQAKLLPEVHAAVAKLMTALLDYGRELGDHSLQSCVVHNGWRPLETKEQGVHYLENIRMVLNSADFKGLVFPASLEAEAKSLLGERTDPRWKAFVKHLGESPGWDAGKAEAVLRKTAQFYVPRGGFNPHTTGLVFDVNFSIYHRAHRGTRKALVGVEDPVNEHPSLNEAALRSAAGMWLNQYSMHYDFDSYNTKAEIWHMEYRDPATAPKPKPPAAAAHHKR